MAGEAGQYGDLGKHFAGHDYTRRSAGEASPTLGYNEDVAAFDEKLSIPPS